MIFRNPESFRHLIATALIFATCGIAFLIAAFYILATPKD